MTPVPASVPSSPRAGPRHLGRWAAIAIGSLLFHLAALDVLPHWTIASSDDTANNAPLRATLMPPIRADDPTPARMASAEPAPPRKLAPRRPLPEFVPESLEPVPQVRAGLQTLAPVGPSPAPAASPASQPASEPASQPASPTMPGEPPALVTPSPPAAPVAVPAVAPQSARLSYAVVYVDRKYANPIQYNGVGTLDWSIADGRYRSTLLASVSIPFSSIDLLSLHSEGSVTSSGVVPDRYTESPRRRSTVATTFNRDARQSITFSSTSASVPLMPGVQDRLSLLFQIGALLLANGQQAAAGGRIDMPVAGIRGEVENWTFESQGVEAIQTGSGPLSTTHLRRTPRPGSNDRTIDVWIAHAEGGYPARVLYTEPNGTTYELTLEKIGTIE